MRSLALILTIFLKHRGLFPGILLGIALMLISSQTSIHAQDGHPEKLCSSREPIFFSVEYPKNIRVCNTIPLQISVANIAEEGNVILKKVVISMSSAGTPIEIPSEMELLPIKGELDEFCQQCSEPERCIDMQPCGQRYLDLRSRTFELSTSVNLFFPSDGEILSDACAGETIEVRAELTMNGRSADLRETFSIRRYGESIPPAQGGNEESSTIYLLGRLPHPPGWFAGDQHSHTSYEKDAGFCIWEWPDSMSSMISAAVSMDLNWQFFTDHSFGIDGTIWNNAYNECANYNSQHPADSYRCLYGEEVATGNRSGQFSISHYLELPKVSDNVGYYADGCSWLCSNCKSEQTVINDINNKGGMGIIAHPYDTDFSWYDWNVTGYSGLEVVNSLDGTWGTEDESSFDKWLSLASGGSHAVGVSDSDAHYASDVGYSFTYCTMSDLSTASIRSAIAEGKCVFGNGPLAYFDLEGKRIGDSFTACPGSRDITIDAYRGDSSMGYLDRIMIYVNSSLRDEITFAENLTEFHGTRQLSLSSGDSFLYLQVLNRGASKTYKAYTNPLWMNINDGSDADGDMYTTCENDCDDSDAQVYPGAPELCDGKDNNCDGTIDEGYPLPGVTAGLSFETDKQTMDWSTESLADRYDVVKGDLIALRSSGGDFTFSLSGCIEDNSLDTKSADTEDPIPDQGFYYLTRAQRACKSGTYNSEQASQIGDRDAEIEASTVKCP